MTAAPKLAAPVIASAARPAAVPSPDQAPLLRLLRVEGEARAAKSLDELVALIANETQLLMRARQTFVCRPDVRGQLQIAAGAGLGRIERDAPLIQSVAAELPRIDALQKNGAPVVTQLWPDVAAGADGAKAAPYPFRAALFVPLLARDKRAYGGVLLLREDGWEQNDLVLARRLALVYAQAWHWLQTAPPRAPLWSADRRTLLMAAGAAVGVALFPIAMSTLAPLEVVARDPHVVAAPMDGVIESIPVASSARVERGDVLVRFAATSLRNRLEVAEREVEVAEVRVKKTTIAAVSDLRARHDLAVAQSELAVKTAERDYAREMLGRSVITAERTGLAVFGDKRELIGRPASTGERIMEIADPDKVDIRINVPVGDAIILDTEKRAKIFLDSEPLSPRRADVLSSDFLARPQENGTAAFRVIARFDASAPAPRLGLRGMAQLYGHRVPLLYYLLRRPIAALRQWAGL